MDLFERAKGWRRVANRGTSGKRGKEAGRARRPMDLTESFTKRCRAILYFIFERRADWTRTLTALVVMLYNAPYMPLFCTFSVSLFGRFSPAAASTPLDDTKRGGSRHTPSVGFFRNKI